MIPITSNEPTTPMVSANTVVGGPRSAREDAQNVIVESGGLTGLCGELVRAIPPGRVMIRPFNFASGVFVELDGNCIRQIAKQAD